MGHSRNSHADLPEAYSPDLPETIYTLEGSIPEILQKQNNDVKTKYTNLESAAVDKEVATTAGTQRTRLGRRLKWRWIVLISVVLTIAIVGGTVGGVLRHKSTFVNYSINSVR